MERAHWYGDPAEDRKYARAARSTHQRARPRGARSYLIAAVVLVSLLAAALFINGGWLNPKTTCTTTNATAPGSVSVQTHCRQVRTFP
jgi:hypothetical protein